MERLSVLHLLTGPLLLLVAILFRAFPPRRVNSLYGYRTPRSMRNDDTWKEANRYSANLMVGLSGLLVVFQAILLWTLGARTSLLLSTGLTVGVLVILIVCTEVHLGRLFDEDGKSMQRTQDRY